MTPKLQKYIAERDRNTRRIMALQERNAKLEKMIADQDNLELHSLLSGAGMSYKDLTEYVRSQTRQRTEPESLREADVEDLPEMTAADTIHAAAPPATTHPYGESETEQEDTDGDDM
jgi:hypothetical protein